VRIVGAAFFAAGLLVVPLASAASFGRPAEIPLVRAPTAAAVTDATQDGVEDLVVTNATAPVLTVLPGKTGGRFDLPIAIGTGPAPRSLAVADFDNDGAEDLAVAGGGAIAIYDNSGGTFVRTTALSAPGVSSVTAADLDLDGNYDLVAASSTRSIVTVFVGTDENTFLPGQEYPSGTPHAAIVAADVNGDELPDVVAGGNALTALFGNGDGTLGPPVSIGGPSEVLALAAEDLDGDGDVDLAVVHRPNRATAMLNTGDGRFPYSSGYAVGATPVAIGVAFLDGDGSLDIATANRGTNDVSILPGTGDGLFHEESRVKVGKGPVALAIEDLNADGLNDLVTANRLGRSVTVLLDGTDAPQPAVCLVPLVAGRTLAVARRLVRAAHCEVASVQRKYSGRIKKGRVISITPPPGTRRPVDTPVMLLVSRGHKSKR
jgi:FG-GAP-like repeat/PASTA domain